MKAKLPPTQGIRCCLVLMTMIAAGLQMSLGVPANDSCAGAITLTEYTYTGVSTLNATDDGTSACLGMTRWKGVWFAYTPAETGIAQVDTCPSDFNTVIEVFSGSCGSMESLGCNVHTNLCDETGSAVRFPCLEGETYLIWAGGFEGDAGVLEIRAFVVPPNDECGGAIEISDGVYVMMNNAKATGTIITQCMGLPIHKGLWFSYTASQNGMLTIDTCPTEFDVILEVYKGECGELVPLACNDDSGLCPGSGMQAAVRFPCIAGTTYRICVGSLAFGDYYDIYIRATVDPLPLNDTCDSSVEILENTLLLQDTTLATDDGYSDCLLSQRSKGVWFHFVGPLSGLAIVDTCASDFDTMLEVFIGPCSSLTPEFCNDDSPECDGLQAFAAFPCQFGSVYYIWAGGWADGSGILGIRYHVVPSNDESWGAIALTEGIYHSQSIHGATDDNHSFCLGDSRNNGVWFTYTPNLTGTATVDTCGSNFDTMVEIFSGIHSNLLPIACNDDSCNLQSVVSFPCSSGQTYFIWAGSYMLIEEGILEIRASCSTVLGNDDCANPFPLQENAYYHENTTSAGDDPPPPGLPHGDQGVWFSFRPVLSGPVTIDTCPSDFDTILGVYTGTCGSLRAVACNDDFPGCGQDFQSRVDFWGLAETSYRIYTGGYGGAYGNLYIRITAPAVTFIRENGGPRYLFWPGAYILESASDPAGPWSEVVEEILPSGFYKSHPLEMTEPRRFFHVK